jgi:hypothetical protein
MMLRAISGFDACPRAGAHERNFDDALASGSGIIKITFVSTNPWAGIKS